MRLWFEVMCHTIFKVRLKILGQGWGKVTNLLHRNID